MLAHVVLMALLTSTLRHCTLQLLYHGPDTYRPFPNNAKTSSVCPKTTLAWLPYHPILPDNDSPSEQKEPPWEKITDNSVTISTSSLPSFAPKSTTSFPTTVCLCGFQKGLTKGRRRFIKELIFHPSRVNRTYCCTGLALPKTRIWVTSSMAMHIGKIPLDRVVGAVIHRDASESFAIPRVLGRRDFSSKVFVATGGSTLWYARMTIVLAPRICRAQSG